LQPTKTAEMMERLYNNHKALFESNELSIDTLYKQIKQSKKKKTNKKQEPNKKKEKRKRKLDLTNIILSPKDNNQNNGNFNENNNNNNNNNNTKIFPLKKRYLIEEKKDEEEQEKLQKAKQEQEKLEKENQEKEKLRKKIFLKKRFFNRLSKFEFFISDIDSMFFSRNDFGLLCPQHHFPTDRTTFFNIKKRVHQFYGKPKRFSKKFLERERNKLYKYRQDVRSIRKNKIQGFSFFIFSFFIFYRFFFYYLANAPNSHNISLEMIPAQLSVGTKVLVIKPKEQKENDEDEDEDEDDDDEEYNDEDEEYDDYKEEEHQEKKNKRTKIEKKKKINRKTMINYKNEEQLKRAKIVEIKEEGYIVQFKNKKKSYILDKNVMSLQSENYSKKFFKITTPDKKNFENQHNFQNTPYDAKKSKTFLNESEKPRVLPHYSDSQLRSICDIDLLLNQKDFLLSILEKKNHDFTSNTLKNSNNLNSNNQNNFNDSDFQKKYALIVCKLNEINLILKNSFSDLYKHSSYSSHVSSPFKPFVDPSPKNVSSEISFRANEIFKKNVVNVTRKKKII
jgi:hypothetical protein